MARPHLSNAEVSGFLGRTLSPTEILSVDDHLNQCDSCRAALQYGRSIESIRHSIAVSAFEENETLHPEFDELAGYVDGSISLDQRRSLETHLESCEQCHGDVEDMRATETSPGQSRGATYQPKVVDIGAARLSSRATTNRFRMPMAAAAAILIAIGAVLIVIYSRETSTVTIENKSVENDQIASVNTAGMPSESTSPTPPGSESARIELEDGGEKISLDSDQKLVGVESAPPHIRTEIESAFKAGRLKSSAALSGLKERSGRLMGPSETPYGLIYPVATVVETQSPKFKWLSVDGAKGYEVTIYDSTMTKVASSDSIQVTSWRPTARLERGKVYTWQVRVIKDDGEELMPPPAAPESRFRILDAARAASLVDLRKSFPRSHLVFGVAYIDAGLLNESVRELRELVAENPKSSLAQSLLRSVEGELAANQKR